MVSLGRHTSCVSNCASSNTFSLFPLSMFTLVNKARMSLIASAKSTLSG